MKVVTTKAEAVKDRKLAIQLGLMFDLKYLDLMFDFEILIKYLDLTFDPGRRSQVHAVLHDLMFDPEHMQVVASNMQYLILSEALNCVVL